MKTFTDLQVTISEKTTTPVQLIEADDWGLIFQFNEPEYTGKEGRAIQDDLERRFKKIYSGSGSGGDGWDVSFNGPKKELEKAKKYV